MTAPRHVLVTGAGGAIGSAVARAMRAAWPGAALGLLDRDATSLGAVASELGGATAHVVDLRAIDALPGVVAAIERGGGPLDGLVNCAGVMRVRHLASWRWEDASDLMAI